MRANPTNASSSRAAAMGARRGPRRNLWPDRLTAAAQGAEAPDFSAWSGMSGFTAEGLPAFQLNHDVYNGGAGASSVAAGGAAIKSAASSTSSLPARAPVWEPADCLPVVERPLLSRTMGLRSAVL